MNNKGISLVYVSLIMSTIFMLIVVVWRLEINDIRIIRNNDNNNKAYYLAEAGVYYGGSKILGAIQGLDEPELLYSVDNPFNEYKKDHSFNISIAKEGPSYRLSSEGMYGGSRQSVQALVTIIGNDIIYSEMKKIE